MQIIKENFKNWSDIIFQEISLDKSKYYWPKANGHNVFDQAYMKFVNRNLNYFNFENMIVTALLDEPEYHSGLTKTLEFCKFVRERYNNKDSPFGRMCVWNIPPKSKILPHRDNYMYHTMITRYIFIVSEHNEYEINIIINNNNISYEKGKLFYFYPAVEKHEFTNNSDKNFYFLGFDVWDKEKLDSVSKKINMKNIKDDLARYHLFGSILSKCKYMSEH